MKKILFTAIVMVLTGIVCETLYGYSSLNKNDPYPVFTSRNPLSTYTAFAGCCREKRASIDVSVFRQRATNCTAEGLWTTNPSAPLPPVTTETGFPEIGDMYGPWNILGVVNKEPDPANIAYDQVWYAVLNALPLQEKAAGLPPTPTDELVAKWSYFLGEYRNTDPAQKFGFYTIPIDYRKYGVRFDVDIDTPFGIGTRIDVGIAHCSQHVRWKVADDLTTTSDWYTKPDSTIPVSVVVTDTDKPAWQNMIKYGIMDHLDVIAKTLELNLDDFCAYGLEYANVDLYWSRCYEGNIRNKDGLPHLTFIPYVIGELQLPTTNKRNTDMLFSVPFGNNGHLGYGFTAGFTLNFLETIELGIEAGMTRWNTLIYPNHPVPTRWTQNGMLPRKADLKVKPGTNWTFGATIAANDFIEYCSFFCQFRLVHHCQDDITLERTRPVGTMSGDFASSVIIDKLVDESNWTSGFIDTGLIFTIAPCMSLGLMWQAPVYQYYAYRSSTLLGSLMFNF